MSGTKVIPDQPAQPKCPQCGTPLPSGALAGLCPACLLKMGAAADTVTEGKQPFTPPSVAELAPLFPQLEILELIGKGGMGAVYKARQKQLDRFVALKILPPGIGHDAAFAERFAREAKALAKLNHPGIVTLYEFGVAPNAGGARLWSQTQPQHVATTESTGSIGSAATGAPHTAAPLYFFLMEFVDGVNLRQLLHAGRISAREALAIVPQICDALQFAHDQGIVHRDIKPENILLDRRGRVKVADFGLAKIVGGNEPLTPSLSPSDGERVAKPGEGNPVLTDAGKVMGTPQYMSPEQRDNPGEVDHRADIYALGVVFYQMLTGELPGKKIEAPSKKVQIDVRLDEVVLRALEKQPELRYQQASVLKTEVETIAETPEPDRRRGDESQTEKPGSQSLLTSAPTNQEARFSRTAIVGACWAAFFFLAALAFLLRYWALPGLKLTLLPLGVTAPFGTTILGWIAISQIRRSAGKLRGMWLAVFDGLLFPLLSLDALIIGGFLFVAESLHGFGNWPKYWWLGMAAVLVSAVIDFLIIRRVWRAVKSPSDGSDRRTPRGPSRATRVAWAGGLAVVIAILGVAAAFLSMRNGSANDIASLVNQPHKLRSLPNATVIQVGLAEPKSAWAWQELEQRARKGLLDYHEILQIVDGFTAWMRREHPEGYHQPLFWFGGLLDALHTRYLVGETVGETNALAFLDAYNGNPSLDPLPRARENASLLQLTCQWRGSWLNQHSLGFELLNEMRSISVDGVQVPVQDGWRRGRWKDQSFTAALKLPPLPPGKHVVRCEIESAFVPNREMAGLAEDATSIDWPPAKRRWTRVCEAEFVVYGEDAEIVSLSDDPALNPVAGGALSAKPIIIRPERGRLMATVSFNADAKPGLPIGVDVTLRLAGQTLRCGKLFEVRTATKGSSGPAEFTMEIEPLDPQIKEAEILLTPNPKAVEEYPYVDRIWGQEIVLSNVPLSRQDLYGAKPVKATSVSDKLSFGPVIERTINRVAAGSNSLLCIRTGALISATPTNSAQDIHSWAHAQQGDAAVGVFGSDVLTGFDMVMVRAPAECWDELTPTQAVKRLEIEARNNYQIMSYGQARSFPDTCLFKTRDGGIGVLQVLQQVPEPPGLKVRYKYLAQPPAVARKPFDPAAPPEAWAPELLPGEKPDLSKMLAEAKELMTKTKYAESLARYVWFYRHAREFGDSYVSRTSVLSEWVELGRRYPKARAALLKIRDGASREFSEERGYADLFEEVADINRHLNDEGATCALFKFVAQHDAVLAQQCYGNAEAALRQCGEYELCLSFLGDPQARFESLRQSWERISAMPAPGGGIPALPIRATLPERALRSSSTNSVGSSASVTEGRTNSIPVPPALAPMFPVPNMAQWAENHFVGQVRNLIEILVGANRLEVAAKIRDQAVALLDDARLKSAVSDAEETVRKVRTSPRRAKADSPPMIVSPGTSTNPNAPLASAENWSPVLAPGEQPDVEKIRQEIRELTQQGHYEDALQRHIWYHNHALEYSSSHAGVRLSFALSEWVELSRRYPKARLALVEIRDHKTRELSEERGYLEMFQDVTAINRELQTPDATYELFKTLEQRDPQLAQQCYFYAEDILVDKGEFELCLRYLGDPQKKFESIRASLERMTAMQKRTEESYRRIAGTNAPVRLSVTAEHQERYFISQTRRLIEILVGAGRKTEAEKIQAQAVSALNVPELQSAVSDAEKRVRQQKSSTSQLSFGPVVERNVAEPFAPDYLWFDIDAERTVALSNYFKPGFDAEFKPHTEWENRLHQEEFKRLKVESGVDISARLDGVPPGFGKSPALGCLEMAVIPTTADKWETATVAELQAAVAGQPLRGQTHMEFREFSHNDPATFFFRTFEGGMGILQIPEYVSSPKLSRSMKIRYKLVRRSGSNSTDQLLFSPASVAEPTEREPAFGKLGDAAAVESTLATMKPLVLAARAFEVDNGRYPASVNELVQDPGDRNWKGLYYSGAWPLLDAWGTPFGITLSDNLGNPESIVTSAGPDRKFGTSDDLTRELRAANKAKE